MYVYPHNGCLLDAEAECNRGDFAAHALGHLDSDFVHKVGALRPLGYAIHPVAALNEGARSNVRKSSEAHADMPHKRKARASIYNRNTARASAVQSVSLPWLSGAARVHERQIDNLHRARRRRRNRKALFGLLSFFEAQEDGPTVASAR